MSAQNLPFAFAKELPLRQVPTWVLLISSGVLMGIAYPPNPVWLCGWLGLVPLLCAIQRAKSYGQVIRWSYLSLFIFSAISSWWIGSWQPNADKFLIISCLTLIVVHPFFFIPTLLVFHLARRRRGTMFGLVLVPFFWCGGEYLHALTDMSYPWLTLGNTQTYNLGFVQFIELTGVWGASFVLVGISTAITVILTLMRRNKEKRKRPMRRAVTWLVGLIVLPYLYGFYFYKLFDPQSPEYLSRDAEKSAAPVTLKITAVQPNVNPWDKWKTADTSDQIVNNADLSRAALRREKPDMFLWTETAVPQPLTEPGNDLAMMHMMNEVNDLGVPVLSGFSDYMAYPDSTNAPISSRRNAMGVRYDYFNSAGLFVPGKGLTGVYHKMQLVPFGERIPFVDLFPFLQKMLKWDVGISMWGKGTMTTVFDVPMHRDPGGAKAASVICFESIYPNIVRRFTEHGAEFLTVITNDGWYLNTPGPVQHERIAMLRAIENRRSIARAANTGISCFIDPYGNIIAESREGERTTLTASVPVRNDLTFYVQVGDWFPQLCLAAAAIMLIVTMTYPDPRLRALVKTTPILTQEH